MPATLSYLNISNNKIESKIFSEFSLTLFPREAFYRPF